MTNGIKDILTVITGYILSLITMVRVQDMLGVIVAILTSVYLIITIIIKCKKYLKK